MPRTSIYDDIIVGAGSAGAVLAARLTEDPHRRVLLLEAGPDYPTFEQLPDDLRDSRTSSLVAHDWRYTATVLPGREIPFPRGKVTGGSSATNAAVALRGVPDDFAVWAALGNDAWDWLQVLPYYRRLETDEDHQGEFHGAEGPLPIRHLPMAELDRVQQGFVAACQEHGFRSVPDFNDPDPFGVGVWPKNRRGEVRISTALSYLLLARGRPNLTLCPHSFVHRVLLEGHQAVGVEVEHDGAVHQVNGTRITLAAGAVASPALLLHSGIGPEADLRALGITPRVDLPGVGANLADHPALLGVTLQPTRAAAEPTASLPPVGLWTTAPGSAERGDLHLMIRTPRDAAEPFGIAVALMRPHSRGRITLRSADLRTAPHIELNFLAELEDQRRMVAGMRLAAELAHSTHLAPYIEQVLAPSVEQLASDTDLLAYARRGVATYNHVVGTASMGRDAAAGAVVDQYCQVHGVAQLQVVDASVMPTIPRANINLTCIMIGERVAAWMRTEPAPASHTTQHVL